MIKSFHRSTGALEAELRGLPLNAQWPFRGSGAPESASGMLPSNRDSRGNRSKSDEAVFEGGGAPSLRPPTVLLYRFVSWAAGSSRMAEIDDFVEQTKVFISYSRQDSALLTAFTATSARAGMSRKLIEATSRRERNSKTGSRS